MQKYYLPHIVSDTTQSCEGTKQTWILPHTLHSEVKKKNLLVTHTIALAPEYQSWALVSSLFSYKLEELDILF